MKIFKDEFRPWLLLIIVGFVVALSKYFKFDTLFNFLIVVWGVGLFITINSTMVKVVPKNI